MKEVSPIPAIVRELVLLLIADEDEAARATNAKVTRVAGVLLWALGGTIAAVLMPLFPPTAAIGWAGWVIAAAGLLGCALMVLRRLDERREPTFDELYLADTAAVVAIAVLGWMAGRGSPYHFLLALPVLHVAAIHRRGRIFVFVAVTILAVWAPAAYLTSRPGLYGLLAQTLLLMALAVISRISFVALRAQRQSLQAAHRRAERLARVDSLTGLGNRRAFEESLRIEVARADRREAQLSLIVADIDDFKRINDRFGHQQGDRYLRAVAAILDESGRMGDLCFRWGGDEFVVLLPETDRAEAERVCERLAASAASAAALTIENERVEMSFGVAQLGEAENGGDLLAAADAILYAHKRGTAPAPLLTPNPTARALTTLDSETPSTPPLELETPRRRSVDQYVFLAISGALVLAAVYLIVLVVAGAALGAAAPVIVLSGAAGVGALIAWQRDRRAAIAAAEAQHRGALDSARLARKIIQLHGGDGDDPEEDVGALIVRVATSLLDAEHGMLLTPSEAPGRALEMMAVIGFGADIVDLSQLTEIAQDALSRDMTVKKNDLAAEGVDSELDNLIAIPLYAQEIPCGVVMCANRTGGFAELEDGVLLSLGDHAGSALQNGRLRAAARRSYLATVTMLLDAIRVKDPSLGGHSIEVSNYVADVADELGVSRKHRERLIFGSLLHDIGKLGIPERILLKAEPLTEEEREIIQTHPATGARLIAQVDALRDLADGILHHHERLDGGGYPDGLSDESISLDARIIAVADSFSAMTTPRPYGRTQSPEEACRELEINSGTQFDPQIVRIFVDRVRRRAERESRPAIDLLTPEETAASDGALVGPDGTGRLKWPSSDSARSQAESTTA